MHWVAWGSGKWDTHHLHIVNVSRECGTLERSSAFIKASISQWHVMCQATASWPTKVNHFRLFDREDDTDTICDLSGFLIYLDIFERNHHKGDATRSSTTNPRDAPAASPAPTAGIFAGIHSRSGDLVDSLTSSGSFAFLSDLFDTDRLFELRDFRIIRVMFKDEGIQKFVGSMHLVLDLADKYPRDSLDAHILDGVAEFLPALLCPCSRRDRVRQIISNTKLFQCTKLFQTGKVTSMCSVWRETDTNAKRRHTRTKRDKSSIQDRVVYVEHCTRGEISLRLIRM
jgi:hypothetical protein